MPGHHVASLRVTADSRQCNRGARSGVVPGSHSDKKGYELTARCFDAGGTVLDLCSSWVSHLPTDIKWVQSPVHYQYPKCHLLALLDMVPVTVLHSLVTD